MRWSRLPFALAAAVVTSSFAPAEAAEGVAAPAPVVVPASPPGSPVAPAPPPPVLAAPLVPPPPAPPWLLTAAPVGSPAPGPVPPPARGPTFDEAWIAPHFADGPALEAKLRYEAGLHEEALGRLDASGRTDPASRYLRGLILLGKGDAPEAAKMFVALAPDYGVLADRVAWYEGMAFERAGDGKRAAAAYLRVPDHSALADDARLSAARMQRRYDASAAVKTLEPLLTRPPSPQGLGRDVGAEALLASAELRALRGEKKAARALYLTLWAEHALAKQSEDALLRADALGGKPELAHELAHGKLFAAAQRNRDSVPMFERVLAAKKLPDPIACEAQFELGRVRRKLREHKLAIEALEAVVKQCRDPVLQAKALYVLGTSASIAQPEKGVRIYESLHARFPAHAYADDALLFAAEGKMKAGDGPGAATTLRQLVEEYPDGDFRADAMFRLFWLARGEGRLQEGLTWLRRLESDYATAPEVLELERSLYWQARTLEQLGARAEAVATWSKVVREHPASFYAMLARGRLATLDPAAAAAAEAMVPDAPTILPALEVQVAGLLPDPRFHAALELLRLGLPKAAADEAWRIDRKAARARGGPEAALAVAWLLDRADARQPAHHVARTEARELLRGRPELESYAPYRIAYPLAFRDIIERHAARSGVEPDLMQALMREESSLDPNVVSWAGAIGLTQLMPATAREVARRLRLPVPSELSLRDPDLNVRIGTAYFGGLVKHWSGSLPLAVASYNAGEGAVGRWLKERGQLEVDEFVEEIPIKETRDYVKRVLRSYSAYRLTYGKGAGRLLSVAPGKAQPVKAEAPAAKVPANAEAPAAKVPAATTPG